MDCKYSYQGENTNGRHYLYCNVTNKLCTYVRYCGIIDDIINSDGYINCPTLKQKEITMGMTQDKPNRVLFEKRGMLAIETNDEIGQVVMVENTFKEVPQWVKLFKKDGKYYAK